MFNWDKLDENKLNLTVIFTSIILLIVTVMYCTSTNFKMGKRFGSAILIVYGLFIAAAVFIGVF